MKLRFYVCPLGPWGALLLGLVAFGLVLGLYSAQLFVTTLLHASLRSTKVVLFIVTNPIVCSFHSHALVLFLLRAKALRTTFARSLCSLLDVYRICLFASSMYSSLCSSSMSSYYVVSIVLTLALRAQHIRILFAVLTYAHMCLVPRLMCGMNGPKGPSCVCVMNGPKGPSCVEQSSYSV
jgi:hypothetical protein